MRKANLLRYLAAVAYDLLLLIGLLFFATAILLPFNGGEAFTSQQFYYPIYLAVVSFFFYGWFWTHGGQTLGLKAWKLKVVSNGNAQVTWQQAFIRFIVSLLSWGFIGLGIAWALVDKQNRTWHDIASKTAILLE